MEDVDGKNCNDLRHLRLEESGIGFFSSFFFPDIIFFLILVFVRVHDRHCKSKCYKLKLLGKLVVQHGIRVSFGERPCVHMFMSPIY